MMLVVAAGANTRVLSYSEVSSALDCWAKWDFSYGGHLAGDALKPKTVAPILSGGRAWGAAIAALHASQSLPNGNAPLNGTTTPGEAAVAALDASLALDADRMREFGVYRQEDHDELRARLLGLILDYSDRADLFPVTDLEGELLVPIPSRLSNRPSSRYRLLCYLDALATDPVVNGIQYRGDWLIEYKLRKRLTAVSQIALSRQIRWYAYAYRKHTGRPIAGVVTIERLNEVPKPARILKSGKPSHAKDQLCTVNAYLDACAEFDEEVHEEVVESLKARVWQQAVPIQFRDGELEEAGRELTSAAKFIHLLDVGDLLPLRNVKAANCNGCRFREICPNPDDQLVDELFERKPPKRLREEGSNGSRDQEQERQQVPALNF